MTGAALWTSALAAFIGGLAGATAGGILVALAIALRTVRPPRKDHEHDR